VTARARALLAVGLAMVVVLVLAVPHAVHAETSAGARRAFVLLVPGVTLDDLLRVPDVAAFARTGGAGWMSPELDVRSVRQLAPPITQRGPDPGNVGVTILAPNGHDPAVLEHALEIIRSDLSSGSSPKPMVVIVGTSGSPTMETAKDDLRPVVVATGQGPDLFASGGSVGTITSDSTRRIGVVAANDVEATIDAFLGHSTAGDAGHAIRIVREAPPFHLHDRYVAMRRMTIPVQTTAALYVTIAGLFAVLVLWLGRRAPAVLGVLASGFAISVGPLAAALLAAGHLPSLSYATVVPFVIGVTVVLVVLVLLGAQGEGVMHPILPLAVVLLAFLLVEDLLGWTAALTPFLGGSELDGGRFFGLPNVFIGLLLGAGLYAAARLPVWAGFAVLVGAALLAGLPLAGANLGGAVTLFAAAGLWLPLRMRGRLRVPELAFAALVCVIGTGVVLVAHRFSSLPTHVTSFEETRGAGGAWSTFVDRLAVGWHLIEHNPFALVPVVGMVVTLAVVLRPPASIGPSLARHPAWRDALLVLLLSSVVAYVVNDSGPAACGVGFGMALGGLLYVSVAERTWKMAPV
jgi:hypothetical protein